MDGRLCEQIPTIFSTFGHLIDVIFFAKLRLDRSRGFGFVGSEKIRIPYESEVVTVIQWRSNIMYALFMLRLLFRCIDNYDFPASEISSFIGIAYWHKIAASNVFISV